MFSCGTNKEGESFLVEWNESEGAVKRTYHGLGKRSVGVVQFDTTKNRFLAAGDEFTIKFWDMDNTNMLTSVEAEGGLLVTTGLTLCFIYLMIISSLFFLFSLFLSKKVVRTRAHTTYLRLTTR